MAGQDWNIPPNTGWAVTQGDVLGFICNFGPAEVYGFQGSEYQQLVQHQVSTVCGIFIAGTWEYQYGSPFDAMFGEYMINTGQWIYDICQAARSSGS
jgi:hypothetical protein